MAGWTEPGCKSCFILSEVKHYRKILEKTVSKFIQILSGNAGIRGIMRSSDRGEKKDRSAFGWYEKALKAHINLTRLYEYFLYSLPDDYGHALPKEVLLYFSYDKSLDQANKKCAV